MVGPKSVIVQVKKDWSENGLALHALVPQDESTVFVFKTMETFEAFVDAHDESVLRICRDVLKRKVPTWDINRASILIPLPLEEVLPSVPFFRETVVIRDPEDAMKIASERVRVENYDDH